ncbi:hypothetical protein SAMN06264855_1276 [Halorubrum vacuolatum]|uniref:Uncharacterized protein n=1 Tax=Halorubrum vacuolatum TaxID=63740 RepID=A0A238Y1V9_HALVU|nr:hypothetical protein SAMN06264855_1276 [Halorubrum vacuolatum]
MTANNATRPTSINTDGAPVLIGQTTEIGHNATESPLRPTQQKLFFTIDIGQSDADPSPLDETTNPAQRRWLRDNLVKWLRFGCERVVQIGGQTACHPASKYNRQLDIFDRPSHGYHSTGSCVDPQRSGGCLIHELFERERMSLQLVTQRPTRRHLCELVLACPRPAEIGLLTEAVGYLDSHDVSVPCLGGVEAHFVNPLYDDIETLRHYQRKGSTVEMIQKDGRWRGKVRERYIAALRDCLAISDELAPAIYPGDTDE